MPSAAREAFAAFDALPVVDGIRWRVQNGIDNSVLRRKMESAIRFLQAPRESFLLLGPRGTGKTTWLRQALPDALVLDLLRPELFRELSARPERLRELAAGAPPRAAIVVDEVQRIPELLTVVHEMIESPARRRFVLTGSSARKLRQGGVDLLGGRALYRTMHPFMAAEWPAFRLEGALIHGLLPLVVDSSEPGEVLAAYATLYLEQEVRLEGWARDIGAFARFLEAVSFSHAQVLNVANIARECSVERKTAAGYLDVLEDLLLSFRLPAFTKRARRATASHPKFYLFDTGVFRSLRPRGPLDAPAEIDGAALEGLVAQHLRAWLAYSSRDGDLATWRTRSGVEVDFVVHGEAGFWAVEVKNAGRVRPEDLAGLEAFGADYPEATRVLLFRGRERSRVRGTWCVPVERFLKEMRPDRGLTDWLED